jgi:hypothetical protein
MSFHAEVFMPATENNNKFWNLARKNEGFSQMSNAFVFLRPRAHRLFAFSSPVGGDARATGSEAQEWESGGIEVGTHS